MPTLVLSLGVSSESLGQPSKRLEARAAASPSIVWYEMTVLRGSEYGVQGDPIFERWAVKTLGSLIGLGIGSSGRMSSGRVESPVVVGQFVPGSRFIPAERIGVERVRVDADARLGEVDLLLQLDRAGES